MACTGKALLCDDDERLALLRIAEQTHPPANVCAARPILTGILSMDLSKMRQLWKHKDEEQLRPKRDVGGA
jgi:hypothetical protein